jgi:transcriptional regulator with XRE-family HTH domain
MTPRTRSRDGGGHESAYGEEIWQQLIRARHYAGLTQVELARRMGVTQAQVARLEKRGYEQYTLTSLRRFVEALGPGFALDVRISIGQEAASVPGSSAAY